VGSTKLGHSMKLGVLEEFRHMMVRNLTLQKSEQLVIAERRDSFMELIEIEIEKGSDHQFVLANNVVVHDCTGHA
jgi:hypothetical protein